MEFTCNDEGFKHKVRPTIPRPHEPQHAINVITSMNVANACKPKFDNRVSDAGSYIEDEITSAGSSNKLHLDLTIAVPSPSLMLNDEENYNLQYSLSMSTMRK